MGNMIRTLTHRIRERGAAAVESLIALPIVIILMMGAAEWARVYEAKTTLDHAAVQGARAGAVDHAQPSAIQQGIARGMLPFYAPRSGNLIQTQAELVATLGTQSRLRILNPTPETFDDFGLTENGRRVLPNSDLKNRSTAIGASSGLNIQDANLLKVETTWGVELRMPFIRQVISFIGQGTTTPGSFEHQLYRNGMIPVSATTLVRMQSEAWENSLMVSIADQGTERTQGGPQEQLATGGTSTPWGGQTGYDGSLASSYVPDHLGNGSDFAHPDWADGHGQGGTGSDLDTGDTGGNSDTPPSDTGNEDSNPPGTDTPKGPECQTTWDDPKYQVEECDSWYCRGIGETFHNLAQGVKVAIHVLGDFIEGLIDGLGDQVKDLLEILEDPSVLLDVAKAFATDPIGTMEELIGSVLDDVETVMQCGPYDIGRILGQHINPAVALKVVGKLAKLSGNDSLARYADDLKHDIECASFPAGTLIWTPTGPVPIEQLSVGDRVESRNTSGFTDADQPIIQELSRTAPGYQRIDTEFGTLTATPEHPFWVQGKGWTEAKDLEWEDPIATLEGDVVAYGNTYVEEPTQVYNFSVANTPNYFAGEAKAWVHNANCVGTLVGSPQKLRANLDPEDNYLNKGWAAHHLITTQKAPGSDALREAAARGVYDQDSALNGIMLPMNKGALPPDGGITRDPILPLHKSSHNGCGTGGCVDKSYQDYVEAKLKKLDESFETAEGAGTPWSDEKLAAEIQKVQRDIEADLLAGRVFLCAPDKCGPQAWQ
ncbi:MAG: polymorphic toxin-type HINT domain-containing protein [Marinobacterium sp.]